MKVARARGALSGCWLLGIAPLLLLMVARSVTGFYKGEIIELWSWLVQLLFPVLGIITASWSVGGTHADDVDVKSPSVFWFTLGCSVFYLIAIYMVVFLEPGSEENWVTVFRNSGIYLGFIQGIVVTALGKFFIENIHSV
jgi:hypothetical protein